MELLTNEWFVGICVGIISGLILFPLQTFIASKLGKKEYLTKVSQANNEVLALLKSAISEGKMPSVHIIESLMSSVSRKYKIKREDLYNLNEVIEDLIREVFDTSFMAMDKKFDIANNLTGLKEKIVQLDVNTDNQNIKYQSYRYYSIVSLIFISTVFAALSSLIAFLSKDERPKFFGEDFQDSIFSIFAIALITLSVVTTFLAFITSKTKKESIEKESRKNSTNENIV